MKVLADIVLPVVPVIVVTDAVCVVGVVVVPVIRHCWTLFHLSRTFWNVIFAL